ncbi:MAG: hypothetical protein ABI376_10280 [Caulobacteraceae bacterium]
MGGWRRNRGRILAIGLALGLLAGCAGAYVAGDVGPGRGTLCAPGKSACASLR